MHTVHLVFTPKNKQATPPTAKKFFNDTTDGLRHRSNVTTSSLTSDSMASSTATNDPSQQSTNTNMPSASFQRQQQQVFMNSLPMTGGGVVIGQHYNASSYAAQQLAMHNWMQHAYAQYFTQYMNL